MAGGIWSSQNKIRPGAYINFDSDTSSAIEVGVKGIVTLPMALDWGEEGKLIELTSNDLYNGNSLYKVGFVGTDAKANLLNLALQNALKVKVFRLNSSGVKATKSINEVVTYTLTTDTQIDTSKTYYTRSGAGTEQSPYVYTEVDEPVVANIGTYYEKNTSADLVVTAKCPGTFGNKIAIVITALTDSSSRVNVQTYADGYLVDSQIVLKANELVANNFVEFQGANTTLSAMSATLLTGGSNGSDLTDYTNYFSALTDSKWDILAAVTDSSTIKESVVTFIGQMRNTEGKYVQAVVSNYDTADYEGIINNVCGATINGVEYNAVDFVAWVAGATAGAEANESLTGKVVTDATTIVNAKSNNQIIEGLQKGEFILSLNQDGNIKVEKDINSLHTFTEKSKVFSKNRIIRELDEIASNIKSDWETTYLGKVTNNEEGIKMFKSSIIDYLTKCVNQNIITEFDSENIVVEQGSETDTVIAYIRIKPLDSMEFLYLTINI